MGQFAGIRRDGRCQRIGERAAPQRIDNGRNLGPVPGLFCAGRLRVLHLGIACFGGWRVWLMAIPLLVYMILAYLYGFFGNVPFDFGVFARSDAARRILVRGCDGRWS